MCSSGDRTGLKLSSTHEEPAEGHVRFFYKATRRRTFERIGSGILLEFDGKEGCA